MAQLVRFLVLSFLMLTLAQARPGVGPRRTSKARAFIESQCRTTLYADLCVRSLSPYVINFTKILSHRQLAQYALMVTLARAESTRGYVTGVVKTLNQTKGKDYEAVRQCLDQINDGVNQLENCIKEAKMIKEDGASSDFTWHASNYQTWMSSALTDAGMCIDGFSGRALGGKTKATIKAKVINLQQLTSNALALFNTFAARFRASSAKKLP